MKISLSFPSFRQSLIIIGVLGLAVLVVWWFLPSSQGTITNLPSQGTEIIAFGDSIIAGVGSTEGHDLPSRLAEAIDMPIRNEGVPGDTTAQGLERIDAALGDDPKVVILLLGGNDGLQNVPWQTVSDNLAELIQRIQARGAAVLLLGIPSSKILGDPYPQMYADLSAKYHTAYVPNVLKGLIGRREYMFDSIHPNDVGYLKLSQRIAPVLEAMVK
jgi:acyl-CoA thioesterase-1